MAWEIVRHQPYSIGISSEQLVDEVQKVSRLLENVEP